MRKRCPPDLGVRFAEIKTVDSTVDGVVRALRWRNATLGDDIECSQGSGSEPARGGILVGPSSPARMNHVYQKASKEGVWSLFRWRIGGSA